MPTLSASDYTTFLKFKAGAASTIKPSIQTRDNVAVSQSLINANVLASQAAFVVTPTVDTLGATNARVVAVQQKRTNNPNALSTIGYAGTSGSLSSSVLQRPGGIPLASKSSQGTYYSPPTAAGWKNAGPPGH